MNVTPECAVEILEIIKYLFKDLKKCIPDKMVEYFESIKNNDYHFEINKNINLFQNEFMDETIEVLMSLMTSNKNSHFFYLLIKSSFYPKWV